MIVGENSFGIGLRPMSSRWNEMSEAGLFQALGKAGCEDDAAVGDAEE